jgi:hypothetical protein
LELLQYNLTVGAAGEHELSSVLGEAISADVLAAMWNVVHGHSIPACRLRCAVTTKDFPARRLIRRVVAEEVELHCTPVHQLPPEPSKGDDPFLQFHHVIPVSPDLRLQLRSIGASISRVVLVLFRRPIQLHRIVEPSEPNHLRLACLRVLVKYRLVRDHLHSRARCMQSDERVGGGGRLYDIKLPSTHVFIDEPIAEGDPVHCASPMVEDVLPAAHVGVISDVSRSWLRLTHHGLVGPQSHWSTHSPSTG